MLQRLTNGKLRSTTHRVVNPTPDRATKARYSMPFFLHFRSDFLIEALPETYREAILLFYYGDLSVAETAARLGIMPEAARVRLHRGRALIRERLVGSVGKEDL